MVTNYKLQLMGQLVFSWIGVEADVMFVEEIYQRKICIHLTDISRER